MAHQDGGSGFPETCRICRGKASVPGFNVDTARRDQQHAVRSRTQTQEDG